MIECFDGPCRYHHGGHKFNNFVSGGEFVWCNCGEMRGRLDASPGQTARKIRALLLALESSSDRVEALSLANICVKCGDDLQWLKDKGHMPICCCEGDE